MAQPVVTVVVVVVVAAVPAASASMAARAEAAAEQEGRAVKVVKAVEAAERPSAFFWSTWELLWSRTTLLPPACEVGEATAAVAGREGPVATVVLGHRTSAPSLAAISAVVVTEVKAAVAEAAASADKVAEGAEDRLTASSSVAV